MYDLRAFMFLCFNLITSSVRATKQTNPYAVRHKISLKLREYLGTSSNKKSNEDPKIVY